MHMVNGLLKQSRRKDFKITMRTYGESDGGLCFGCAATCTIQNLSKSTFTANMIGDPLGRAGVAHISFIEFATFETAINRARTGDLRHLFDFCGIETKNTSLLYADFDLQDNNWKKQLPQVKKTIFKLKKAGY